MPGMRILADLACAKCGREYYGDLRAGHALFSPTLLCRQTGKTYEQPGANFMGAWLRNSYAHRVDASRSCRIEVFKPLDRVIVLNCLDRLYGHCLLKLLNAQYYLDHCRDLALVVIVPKFLRWMVPAGVAAVWSVDLPLKHGAEWNDGFAIAFAEWSQSWSDAWLSVAYSHPSAEHFSIDRFTDVKPFVHSASSFGDAPLTVTYVWREDRLWLSSDQRTRVGRRLRSLLDDTLFRRRALTRQMGRVSAFFRELGKLAPGANMAIAGIGGAFPPVAPGVIDGRRAVVTPDIEREWCRRYAVSNVVVGVHGSNMLLPSAHAGATVDLMPNDRWGNAIQDLIVREPDSRVALHRFRLLPLSADPAMVADVVAAISQLDEHIFMHVRSEAVDHAALVSIL